jgi:hypothetical protein
MAFALVFDKVPQTGMNQKLFVVAEPMQFVKNGVMLRLVSIERVGKYDAVGNAAGKDFTGDGIAFDAARSGGGRDAKEVEEGKEVKEKA